MIKKTIILLVTLTAITLCFAEWSIPRSMSIDASYYGPKDRPESGLISIEVFKLYGGKFSLYGNLGGYYGSRDEDTQAGDDVLDENGNPVVSDEQVATTTISTFYLPFTVGGRVNVYESKGMTYFLGLGIGLGFAVDMSTSNLLSTAYEYGLSDAEGTSLKDYLKDHSNAYYGFNYQLSTGVEYTAKPGLNVYGKLFYNGAKLNRDTGVSADKIELGNKLDMSGFGAGLGIRFAY